MQQVANESKLLIESEMTTEERREKLQLIGQLLNESLKKGEEKFALAKTTYDTVKKLFSLYIKKKYNNDFCKSRSIGIVLD